MLNINIFGRHFKITFLIIIIVESISFISFVFLGLNTALFIGITCLVFILSLYKLEIGFFVLLTELIIGGKGYLFSMDIHEYTVSIRLAIFIAVIAAWIIYSIRKKTFPFFRTKLFWPLVGFVGVLLYAVIIGFLSGNESNNIFLDVNGFLYLGAAPLFIYFISDWKMINKVLQTIFAGVLAISAKTLFVITYFSHETSENAIFTVYKWVRETGIGEITNVDFNFYRVFFQSHIFLLFILFLSISFLIFYGKEKIQKSTYNMLWISIVISSTVLIACFSRSLWIAAATTFIFLIIYFIKRLRWRLPRIGKFLAITGVIVILDVLLLTFLINVPLPGGSGEKTSAFSLVTERVSSGTEEVAIASRMNLLKPLLDKSLESPFFGSGFGETVSYETKDPRAVETTGGMYTTFSFEWGYLDFIVKLGLLGTMVVGMFFWKIWLIGRHAYKNCESNKQLFINGLLFCYLALMLTHVSTPYLNHPLGIGYTLIIAAMFIAMSKNHKTIRDDN
ncbi:O-antigen ligase family protein [Patescibacteria group bacterium]